MNNSNKRPVYLNLFQIRMPVAAVVSILHRISGVLLLLFIPYFVYLFDLSLQSEQGFQQVKGLFDSFMFRLLTILLTWLLVHHFCAGIRFLLIDLDVGVEKLAATRGAWFVHVAALAMTLLILSVLL